MSARSVRTFIRSSSALLSIACKLFSLRLNTFDVHPNIPPIRQLKTKAQALIIL